MKNSIVAILLSSLMFACQSKQPSPATESAAEPARGPSASQMFQRTCASSSGDLMSKKIKFTLDEQTKTYWVEGGILARAKLGGTEMNCKVSAKNLNTPQRGENMGAVSGEMIDCRNFNFYLMNEPGAGTFYVAISPATNVSWKYECRN